MKFCDKYFLYVKVPRFTGIQRLGKITADYIAPSSRCTLCYQDCLPVYTRVQFTFHHAHHLFLFPDTIRIHGRRPATEITFMVRLQVKKVWNACSLHWGCTGIPQEGQSSMFYIHYNFSFYFVFIVLVLNFFGLLWQQVSVRKKLWKKEKQLACSCKRKFYSITNQK